MANRFWTQFRYTLEKKPVDVYAKVSIGSTGAPTLVSALSKGVASIARDSAGLYTVTLQDAYYDIYMVQAVLEDASGAPASGYQVVIRAQDVDVAKTVQIAFLDAAGAETEIDSGTVVRLKFELKGSTV